MELASIPLTVKRLINEVVADILHVFCYLDDVIPKTRVDGPLFDCGLYACYATVHNFPHHLDVKNFVFKMNYQLIMHRFQSNTETLTPHQQRCFNYIAQMTNKVEYVAGEYNAADFSATYSTTSCYIATFI